MKKLTLVLIFILAGSAFAANTKKLDFSKIDLVGMQLLDSENNNGFIYKLKLNTQPTVELINALQEQSMSKIVSPIFELDGTSSFKNIYVYVGQTQEGQFEFVQAYQNKSGSIFVVDMNIVEIKEKQLKLEHGIGNDKQTYTVKKNKGKLFNPCVALRSVSK